MSTPAIEVDNLSHWYGTLQVLHSISFRVEPGEIYGFIGPNGAGKTTTIRAIATLLRPAAGTVRVAGLDVSLHPAEVKRLIGYMPDHAGVYKRLSVREYLDFFAHSFDIVDPDVAGAVLELTELAELTDKLVADLSKGMCQRLQIARVLLHDPEVLILDEPASDLDPRARIEIRDLLLELRELGKTILLSSHILSELSDVCTSVGIIDKGRLIVSGPLGEVAERFSGRRTHSAKTSTPLPLPLPAQGAPSTRSESPASADGVTREGSEAKGTTRTPGGALVPAGVQHGLRLRVLRDGFRLAPLLAACPAVTSIEDLGGGQVKIKYIGNDEFVAELVQYLVSHGLLLVAVEPEQNELERVFLEVTQGGKG